MASTRARLRRPSRPLQIGSVLLAMAWRKSSIIALWPLISVTAAEEALRSGENKIGRLFERVPIHVIGEEELESAGFSNGIFRNVNTPDELQASAYLAAPKAFKV